MLKVLSYKHKTKRKKIRRKKRRRKKRRKKKIIKINQTMTKLKMTNKIVILQTLKLNKMIIIITKIIKKHNNKNKKKLSHQFINLLQIRKQIIMMMMKMYLMKIHMLHFQLLIV